MFDRLLASLLLIVALLAVGNYWDSLVDSFSFDDNHEGAKKKMAVYVGLPKVLKRQREKVLIDTNLSAAGVAVPQSLGSGSPVAQYGDGVRAETGVVSEQITAVKLPNVASDLPIRKDDIFFSLGVEATHGLVQTLDGQVLASRSASESRPIASITKLVTALVAQEVYQPDEIFAIDAEAIEQEGEAGSFVEGETFVRDDLVAAMVLTSSNDAAFALAAPYGQQEFVDRMNQKAQELGLVSTYFTDPTGLSIRNRSSANDIARLLKFLYEREPQLLALSKIPVRTVVSQEKGEHRLVNVNRLVHQYPNLVVGGKTGSLPLAGENIAFLLKMESFSNPLVVVLLNARDRYQDAQKIIDFLKSQ